MAKSPDSPLIPVLCDRGIRSRADLSQGAAIIESYSSWPKYHSQSDRNLLRKAHSIPERGVQMKKLLLGTVALAALAVPATAADMGIRPRAVAYVPAFSWTGCHIGGTVGYGWGNDDGYSASTALTVFAGGAQSAFPIPAQPITNGFATNGFLGGGYAGCDYQFGAWVIGVEGDWQSVNKEGQAQFLPGIPFNAHGGQFFTTDWMSAKERWLATVRGRVGYAVDRWLLFVSGGVAWAKVDTEFFGLTGNAFTSPPFDSAEQHDRRNGWTVGAGVEYAPPQLNGPFNGQWTIRAEYLYVQLPSYNTLTNPSVLTGPGPGSAFSVFPLNVNNGRMSNNMVRFGLAYKFGGFAYAAPAVVK
jgi:outer membrane immunogenic protein